MIKWISKRPEAFCRKVTEQKNNISTAQKAAVQSFIWQVEELSGQRYRIRAQDPWHELACELILETKQTLRFPEGVPDGSPEEDGFYVPVLSGEFPALQASGLDKKTLGDVYLQNMVVMQFLVKMMEQLLLFCEDKDAVTLSLGFNEQNNDYVEVYRGYFNEEAICYTSKGKWTRIGIPTSLEVYDEVIDFIDHIEQDFRSTLWREQRFNPVIRQYLKEQIAAGYYDNANLNDS